MKTISLTDKELKELIDFYEQKLATAQKRVDEIQEMIDQLTLEEAEKAKMLNQQIPDKSTKTKKRGRKRKKITSIFSKQYFDIHEKKVQRKSATIRKRTPKSSMNNAEKVNIKDINWESFVLNLLDTKNKILRLADFIDYAIVSYQLFEIDRNLINDAIQPFLLKLTNTNLVLKQQIEGETGHFYALPAWLNEVGVIKVQYTSTTKQKENKYPIKSASQTIPIEPSLMEIPKTNEWGKFIINNLSELDRPLSIDEFADIARKNYNLKTSERRKVSEIINTTLREMHYKENLLKRHLLKGTQIFAYGLPDWFDENDELKESYIRKIE